MRRISLVYGLIAGLVVSVLLWIWMYFFQKGYLDLDNGEIYGYGSMIVALSMVFFGIRSFRDNYNGGSIRFWKGVQVGLLISLIAALVYTAGWEIYFQTNQEAVNGFFDKYTEHHLNKLRAAGAAQAEIDQTANEMANFREWYGNPLIRFGATLAEILPVGVIVTFISAGLLRRKELLPQIGDER